MNISKDDAEWIEKFYSDLEAGLSNYTRPTDYIERAMRVLSGSRNECKTNSEGLTKWANEGE